MYKTLAVLCVLGLSACASQKPAQIVMHNGGATERPSYPSENIPFKPVFGDVKQSKPVPIREMSIQELKAPERKPRSDVEEPKTENVAEAVPEGQTIEVKKGDTLYIIARRHGIAAKVIAEANQLKAPYDLSGVTSLKLPAEPVKVAGAPIPRFRPETTQVAAIIEENDGFKPFSVHPSFERKNHFIWPVAGKVISRFGPKSGGLYNDGVNIAAAEGAPIYASMDGQVVYAGNDLASYGNLVILRHKNGWLTAYAHTKEINVHKGDKVKMGQVIALVGQTGNVTTPQVHFGIRDGKKPLDPVLKVSG